MNTSTPVELGEFVSLIAEGPGDPLWYTDMGIWVDDPDHRKVFTGVQAAIRTPIIGLPPGYKAHLFPIRVEVVAQCTEQPWCCNEH